MRSVPSCLPQQRGSWGTGDRVTLPIPNSQSLVGTVFYHQALAYTAGANPANLQASYSTRGVVGRFQ